MPKIMLAQPINAYPGGSFSVPTQFSVLHKWQLFEISARFKLVSVPLSSLFFNLVPRVLSYEERTWERGC